MTGDPPAGAGGLASARLIIEGRSAGWRLVAGLGWSWLALGLLWTVSAICCASWYAIPSAWGEPVARQGLWVAAATAGVLCVLLLGAGSFCLAFVHLSDSLGLRRLQVAVDARGVSRAGRAGRVVPWMAIRHVRVTAGNPGWRRLLIDDGGTPEAWWRRSTIYPGRAQLRQLTHRGAFLVNVPIDRLAVDPEVILRAIHDFSGGRFPDQQPPRAPRSAGSV